MLSPPVLIAFYSLLLFIAVAIGGAGSSWSAGGVFGAIFF
jgi:hypothetical protein